jgi:hypothetical protein
MVKIIGLLGLMLALQSCGSATNSALSENTNSSNGSPTPTPTTPPTGGTTIPTSCKSALPSGAQAVNVSNPTKVIGSGTPASCTFAALKTAVAAGGIITFNCGTNPVTSTMNLPISLNTVIDGGGRVTLDGQSAVQILRFDSSNFMVTTFRVTLQNITIINGKTTPTKQIPTAPAPCSQGYDDGQGGAIYMRDGNLTIINSVFSNNQAACWALIRVAGLFIFWEVNPV